MCRFVIGIEFLGYFGYIVCDRMVYQYKDHDILILPVKKADCFLYKVDTKSHSTKDSRSNFTTIGYLVWDSKSWRSPSMALCTGLLKNRSNELFTASNSNTPPLSKSRHLLAEKLPFSTNKGDQLIQV